MAIALVAITFAFMGRSIVHGWLDELKAQQQKNIIDAQVERQPEMAETSKNIDELKASQGDKWFNIEDLEKQMS